MKATKRELLYSWTGQQFMVLVPKRRGKGYLLQPMGHHADEKLGEIASVAGCDIFGLDGSLNFNVPSELYFGSDEEQEAFVALVVPLLEAHYGCTSRNISSTEHFDIIEAAAAERCNR